MEFSHVPVLFNEAVNSLNISPDKIYVDCTGGGGGHSMAIAQKLSQKGKLIIFDRDPDAIKILREKFSSFNNVIIIKENFINIRTALSSIGISGVDGVLADLGVSSYQLDETSRGFSFHRNAVLDMRMSREGISALDIVNSYSESELFRIISCYGEEKFARGIAKKICTEREKKPIETTFELADIVSSAVPAKFKRDSHPARKTFQAIRIEVNGELEDLPNAIMNMFSVLNVGGVLSVITFHSLENRAVKTVFKNLSAGCDCPREFPVCVCGKTPQGKTLKEISPDEKELCENPRSRSARLRTIIKLK